MSSVSPDQSKVQKLYCAVEFFSVIEASLSRSRATLRLDDPSLAIVCDCVPTIITTYTTYTMSTMQLLRIFTPLPLCSY